MGETKVALSDKQILMKYNDAIIRLLLHDLRYIDLNKLLLTVFDIVNAIRCCNQCIIILKR